MPTATLDNYTLALELEVRNTQTERRESVFAGTGTVDTTNNTKAIYEFAIPRGVFTRVDDRGIDGEPIQIKARIVAARWAGGRLQHAQLYFGDCHDGEEHSMYFDYEPMPISTSSTALRWHDQVTRNVDMAMLPALSVSWTRELDMNDLFHARRENAPSKVVARFVWETPNDSDDMSVVDACMALEHYADWK